MNSKLCSSCKLDLPLDSFNKKSKSIDGLQGACKSCSKKLNAIYYQDNKSDRKSKIYKNKKDAMDLSRAFVIEKLSTGCIDCFEKDLVVLDFDHLEDKKYSISNMIRGGYSIETISKEIEKCVVRCANCHRRKTAKDFSWWKVNIK